jgi:antitoxin component YwqK of YwqJK toxin-antitoxin module
MHSEGVLNMPKFRVKGCLKENAEDVEVIIEATSYKEAERTANKMGILVSDVLTVEAPPLKKSESSVRSSSSWIRKCGCLSIILGVLAFLLVLVVIVNAITEYSSTHTVSLSSDPGEEYVTVRGSSTVYTGASSRTETRTKVIKISAFSWSKQGGTFCTRDGYRPVSPEDAKKIEAYINGRKKIEENYKDGKPEGKWTDWYGNGQKKSEGKIKDGKKDGKWTEWYSDGQIESEANYKDGKPEGKWTNWYENGQIESEGNYKDDKLVGKLTWWDANGQKLIEGNFKDGKKDGKWTRWYENAQKIHENGQKMNEGNYKDGKKDGKWTWWGKNGQIESEANYKDGVKVD